MKKLTVEQSNTIRKRLLKLITPMFSTEFVVWLNANTEQEDECTGVEFTKGCPKCEATLLEREGK